MSVEREEVQAPFAVGSAVVTRIYRGAAGGWSVEFDLNFRIKVGDGREVFVRRFINTRANEQRGRRVRQPVVNAAGTSTYDMPQIIEVNEDGSPHE